MAKAKRHSLLRSVNALNMDDTSVLTDPEQLKLNIKTAGKKPKAANRLKAM